jgi:hypothetical protein
MGVRWGQLIHADEAVGVFGEALLAYLAAEGVSDSVPRSSGCYVLGAEEQTTYWVSFSVAALRPAPYYFDKRGSDRQFA